MNDLHVRTSADWTVVDVSDMHGEGFRVAHWHPNAHVSLSLPVNRAGFHTRQLGRHQCAKLGTMLLRLSRTGQLCETAHPDDFQI